MALSSRERNAVAKAVELGGAALVRRVRYGVYEVPSATEAGVVYRVEQRELGWVCSCPAGEQGQPCWHKASVLIAKTQAASGCRVKGPAGPAAAPAPRRRGVKRVALT